MSKKKLPPEVLDFFKKEGSKGGKKGGKARMSSMTAEQRGDLAKKAAAARWKKPATKKAALKAKLAPEKGE